MVQPAMRGPGTGRGGPPVFNAPRVVVISAVVLFAIWGFTALVPNRLENLILTRFAFLPTTYAVWPQVIQAVMDGQPAPIGRTLLELAPFVTHAFLHASFMHVLMNSVWLLAIGTPVAQRIGTTRFLLMAAICAIGGAALHLAFRWDSPVLMLGASGSVSGLMGAAMRFVLNNDPEASGFPVAMRPLLSVMDKRIIAVTVIWTLFNLFLGTMGGGILGGGNNQIAWEAHVGGFLTGLFLMPLFDRHRAPGRGPRGGRRDSGDFLRRIK